MSWKLNARPQVLCSECVFSGTGLAPEPTLLCSLTLTLWVPRNRVAGPGQVRLCRAVVGTGQRRSMSLFF